MPVNWGRKCSARVHRGILDPISKPLFVLFNEILGPGEPGPLTIIPSFPIRTPFLALFMQNFNHYPQAVPLLTPQNPKMIHSQEIIERKAKVR